MKELLTIYRAALHNRPLSVDVAPCRLPADRGNMHTTLMDVAHVLWMLDQMDAMLDQLDTMPLRQEWGALFSKFHRWLGFVQGWMWHQHVFTLDQLREQTRVALEC